MPTPLPITITGTPLPSGIEYTPQELFDAIVERLTLETQESLALFGTGSVLPTSDEGPFLLDGTKWYVWDTVGAEYIPAVVEFKEEVDTIPFRANSSGPQDIVFVGPATQEVDLVLTDSFDPNSVFAANEFVAPVDGFYNIKARMAISATAGSPTDVTVLFYLKKNGFQMPKEIVFDEVVDPAKGRTYLINTDIQLAEGDSIMATVGVSIGGGSGTFTVTENDTFLSGFKIRNLTFEV